MPEEGKDIKREYARNRYRNMSDEEKISEEHTQETDITE